MKCWKVDKEGQRERESLLGEKGSSFLVEYSICEEAKERVRTYYKQHGDQRETKLYEQRDIIDVSGLGKGDAVATTHDGSDIPRKEMGCS